MASIALFSSRLNVVEKAGFSFAEFPRVSAYLDEIRARPAWKETPKLPGL
jgi:glutathione S-transferase